MTRTSREISRAFPDEAAFIGRGAKQQAEKALRLMLDAAIGDTDERAG